MKSSQYCKIIILFTLFTISSTSYANGMFRFVRNNPVESNEKILEFVDDESNVLITKMNEFITIPKDIVFIFGAEDGPLYDPDTREILMTDDFTYDVMDRFIDANYVDNEEQLFNVTMDVVEHTLYHELAHALIDILKLPVLGKEEDTADNLATMLVIHTNENGSDIALSAADFFDLEGEEIEELTDEDFWGEHSLDFQRFYNTVCLIYGSEPKQSEYLIEELNIDENRAQLCIDDYHRQNESWKKILQPHLKNKALLN